MGLSGMDDATGVRFKKRNSTPKIRKKETPKETGLVIDKPSTKKDVKAYSDVLGEKYVGSSKSIKKESDTPKKPIIDVVYKASIGNELVDYDFATDSDVNDTGYSAVYLGKGFTVRISSNDTEKQDPMPNLLYFWKKVEPDNISKVSDAYASTGIVTPVDDSGLDGDVVNNPLEDGLDENPDVIETPEVDIKSDIDSDKEIGDHDGLTNTVNQKEEELTMKKYPKADEILNTLKESGEAGVDVLIDYCKISFAEVFTKTNQGIDPEVVTTDLQDQMVYIISEINKNELLSDEAKAKLIKAIEKESDEYKKLFESFENVNEETKTILDKKEETETSWGMITGLILGTAVAIAGLYAAYRYFEPGDVVIDMSTMSVMDR